MQSTVQTLQPQRAIKHRRPLHNFTDSLTDPQMKYIFFLFAGTWKAGSQPRRVYFWPKSDKMCEQPT